MPFCGTSLPSAFGLGVLQSIALARQHCRAVVMSLRSLVGSLRKSVTEAIEFWIPHIIRRSSEMYNQHNQKFSKRQRYLVNMLRVAWGAETPTVLLDRDWPIVT